MSLVIGCFACEWGCAPTLGEPDPIYYPADEGEDYGMWSCPECGWEVQDYCYTNHANGDER